MNNKKTWEEIKKYDTFVYDKFNINYEENYIEIIYDYKIINLKEFKHIIKIPYAIKNIDKEFVEKLAFNIGLLEIVSYWKATLAPNIIVNCGKINEKQQHFFKKVYYYGLSELIYKNKIKLNYADFVNFKFNGNYYDKFIEYKGSGNLIAVGGGKDSCVTLDLYSKENSGCLIINPKEVMLNCAYAAGYEDRDIYKVYRTIDKNLLELNDLGFLNGHTPFSAMVAFVSFLTAYLNNKKYIVLSNESSANETNILGEKINHQYSKSYEFEKDFQDYAQEFLNKDIKYYSFLRPLTEYQIAMIFAKYPKFHHIFKSCNVGSKNMNWTWCCNCAKCLFIYSLLSPFLYKDELIAIFKEDLFTKENMLPLFLELLGKSNIKPFECVGTFEEINYAITKTIKKLDKNNLPYLLKYYYDNYYDEKILNIDLEHFFDNNNSLLENDIIKLKEILNND